MPTPRARYHSVKALILTFALNDLDLMLDTEYVIKAFILVGYNVELYPIPMDDSTNKLNEKLIHFMSEANEPGTLFIIYYSGHGGVSFVSPSQGNGGPRDAISKKVATLCLAR